MPSIALCDGGLYNFSDVFVYVLKSEKLNQIYIGKTIDLKKRLKDHNSGKSAHTKKFKPWQVVWYCGFAKQKKLKSLNLTLKLGQEKLF